jgi:hypothetical protein
MRLKRKISFDSWVREMTMHVQNHANDEALIQAINNLILKYIQTIINGIYGGNN